MRIQRDSLSHDIIESVYEGNLIDFTSGEENEDDSGQEMVELTSSLLEQEGGLAHLLAKPQSQTENKPKSQRKSQSQSKEQIIEIQIGDMMAYLDERGNITQTAEGQTKDTQSECMGDRKETSLVKIEQPTFLERIRNFKSKNKFDSQKNNRIELRPKEMDERERETPNIRTMPRLDNPNGQKSSSSLDWICFEENRRKSSHSFKFAAQILEDKDESKNAENQGESEDPTTLDQSTFIQVEVNEENSRIEDGRLLDRSEVVEEREGNMLSDSLTASSFGDNFSQHVSPNPFTSKKCNLKLREAFENQKGGLNSRQRQEDLALENTQNFMNFKIPKQGHQNKESAELSIYKTESKQTPGNTKHSLDIVNQPRIVSVNKICKQKMKVGSLKRSSQSGPRKNSKTSVFDPNNSNSSWKNISSQASNQKSGKKKFSEIHSLRFKEDSEAKCEQEMNLAESKEIQKISSSRDQELKTGECLSRNPEQNSKLIRTKKTSEHENRLQQNEANLKKMNLQHEVPVNLTSQIQTNYNLNHRCSFLILGSSTQDRPCPRPSTENETINWDQVNLAKMINLNTNLTSANIQANPLSENINPTSNPDNTSPANTNMLRKESDYCRSDSRYNESTSSKFEAIAEEMEEQSYSDSSLEDTRQLRKASQGGISSSRYEDLSIESLNMEILSRGKLRKYSDKSNESGFRRTRDCSNRSSQNNRLKMGKSVSQHTLPVKNRQITRVFSKKSLAHRPLRHPVDSGKINTSKHKKYLSSNLGVGSYEDKWMDSKNESKLTESPEANFESGNKLKKINFEDKSKPRIKAVGSFEFVKQKNKNLEIDSWGGSSRRYNINKINDRIFKPQNVLKFKNAPNLNGNYKQSPKIWTELDCQAFIRQKNKTHNFAYSQNLFKDLIAPNNKIIEEPGPLLGEIANEDRSGMIKMKKMYLGEQIKQGSMKRRNRLCSEEIEPSLEEGWEMMGLQEECNERGEAKEQSRKSSSVLDLDTSFHEIQVGS